MSQEAKNNLLKLDAGSIDTQLALQCAPLIAGLKVSNLLIVPRGSEGIVRSILQSSGISCYRLLICGKRETYLLFRKEQLGPMLMKEAVGRVLTKAGYERHSLEYILMELGRRYQAYMNQFRAFPHEMGLILGYPVEDVEGFVQNDGKNFLCAGYWKVYANEGEKKKLFRQFDAARDHMLGLLCRGMTISGIISLYGSMEHNMGGVV